MNRAELQTLADLRIAEAECLFQNGMYEGAYYLAGYAVECGLKACVAKRTQQFDFPMKNTQRDCYTHDFQVLFRTAKLDTIFEGDLKSDAPLDGNWAIVREWKEDCRYDLPGSTTRVEVEQFLLAIGDPQSGVLSWVKGHW